MTKAILVSILISTLWIQLSVGFKCYGQQCQADEDGNGYRCYFGAEGDGDINGKVGDDKFACYESREIRDGKLWGYFRRGVTWREDYDSSEDNEIKAKTKEGCVTEEDDVLGEKYVYETCHCFKDLCNIKNQIPQGAKHGWGNEE